MPPIRAAVFDFDGTLVDASEAIFASFNAVLRDQGIVELTRAQLAPLIGKPLTDMFSGVDPSAGPEQLNQYVDAYRRHFFPLSRPLSRALPGVRDALQALSAAMPVAIATTRRADGAEHILQGLGMQQWITTIVGLEHVRHPKPHPEPVLLALQRVGVSAPDAVMIGDTPDDIAAGRAAGAMTVGVCSGAHGAEVLGAAGADHVIASMAALPALLEPLSCSAPTR